MFRKGAEIASREGNPSSSNRSQQMSARETGDESEVDEQQRGAKSPVHEAEVEDFTEDIVVDVGDMLVLCENVGEFKVDALAGGESEINNEGNGGDQRTESVEHPLGLRSAGVSLQLISGERSALLEEPGRRGCRRRARRCPSTQSRPWIVRSLTWNLTWNCRDHTRESACQ